MSLAESHRVIPEPSFSPCLYAVDSLELSVAASSNLRLQLLSPPECQEESCGGQVEEEEEDCEGGEDLISACKVLSYFKRTLKCTLQDYRTLQIDKTFLVRWKLADLCGGDANQQQR